MEEGEVKQRKTRIFVKENILVKNSWGIDEALSTHFLVINALSCDFLLAAVVGK